MSGSERRRRTPAAVSPRRRVSCARRSTTTTPSTCSPTAPDEYRAAHDGDAALLRGGGAGHGPAGGASDVSVRGRAAARLAALPEAAAPLPVAVILPGLDACKEELHAWSDAFLARGLATLTLDGPGQGESAFALPIRTDWGKVIGAVIDGLKTRSDVDADAVGVVGQSLGAFYAPLAASQEPRIKACIANCGPYDWGACSAADAEGVAGGVPRPQPCRDHRAGSRDRQSDDA